MKKAIPIIIFSLAALLLILGIMQLILTLAPLPDQLDAYRAQGATEEQVSDALWQQVIPPILNDSIVFLGFTGVLIAGGLISMKVGHSEETAPPSIVFPHMEPMMAPDEAYYEEGEPETESIPADQAEPLTPPPAWQEGNNQENQ